MLIGILTSGGDAPGMNAVIAAACEEVERRGGRALGVRGGFGGLASRQAEPIAALQARTTRTSPEPGSARAGGRCSASRRGARPAARRSTRSASPGFWSSEATAPRRGRARCAGAVPVAVVPATIDRDIDGTALTIGMDSAILYAADAIDRLRITGRSLPGRAFLVQTLGAPNGFLADAAAAAAGIDDVLVPERPYDLDDLARRLRERSADGSAIAVMSEAVGDAVRVAEDAGERAAGCACIRRSSATPSARRRRRRWTARSPRLPAAPRSARWPRANRPSWRSRPTVPPFAHRSRPAATASIANQGDPS